MGLKKRVPLKIRNNTKKIVVPNMVIERNSFILCGLEFIAIRTTTTTKIITRTMQGNWYHPKIRIWHQTLYTYFFSNLIYVTLKKDDGVVSCYKKTKIGYPGIACKH